MSKLSLVHKGIYKIRQMMFYFRSKFLKLYQSFSVMLTYKIYKPKNITIILVFVIFVTILVSFLHFQTNPKQVLGINDLQKTTESRYQEIFDIATVLPQPVLVPAFLNEFFGRSVAKPLQQQNLVLEVPLIKQIYSLSCEAAAIQMILAYRGIESNQDQLMREIGFAEPIEIRKDGGDIIWGDPDLGFVGVHNGIYAKVENGTLVGDGWGVNEGPVLNTVRKYLGGSYAKVGAEISDLRQSLEKGMPVIIWLVQENHRPEKIEYLTPQGKRVIFQQFHVVVLVGLEVNDNGLETWIINDPIHGVLKYSTTQLQNEWQKYGSRMVAVG